VNPEAFEHDILAEPAGLDALAAGWAGRRDRLGLADLRGRRVVLIGMGSSRYAALPAAARLRTAGVHAVAEMASTALPVPPGPDVVAVGISASGRSVETLSALARHQRVSRTVAITNHADSELGRLCDFVLPLGTVEERGGVACISFQATVALLHLVCGGDADTLRRAAQAQATLFGAREAWVDELLETLGGAHTVYTVSPDERISSALQGALMLREGPRIPAAACETADWSHVDVYLSRHAGYRAVLFTGSSYEPELLHWAQKRESLVVAIGRDVSGSALHVGFGDADDPVVAALVETSVLELAAAVWWQRRVADGTMPGDPRSPE
jgi:glutamine---fructose-6-phosphate transaminase (isomerizing)